MESGKMGLIYELQELGADIEDGIQRFIGNVSMYERMLRKFPPAFRQVKVLEPLRADSLEEALISAHTLKGMTGNLSLTPLFLAYSDIVTLLREGSPQEAGRILEDILPVQERFLSCIEKYL
ncbi:MAG: hypothetical protein ACI4D5_07805 [Kineothrix sp.]